ncbi:MAG: DUF4330 domain-containing protein [Oscillospiraceae bacterium]|nr:DUF4330 domain-containing protein [Oscillospiraceae bacterium]MCD7934727.1 DUF4330 domain-containing protein [Oscillospiraceae bacterium]
MENANKPRRSIFNLFDIVVIAIIVVLALALCLSRSSGGSASGDTASGSRTVRYMVEFTGIQNGAAALMQPGDELVDKIKKYDIGTVVSVEIDNTRKLTQDYTNGGMVDSALETQQTATAVIEAECTETDADILVSGGYAIKVGTSVSAKGPGYQYSGTIIGIERDAA